jgi:predicted MPP superfamily phosphohydrolase
VAPASLITPSARAVAITAALVTLWGFANARRTARVVRVDVPITGLPATLDGFTIAQVSDVHVGPTIKRPYVEAIVDAVNRLDVDLVAVTGDLVDGSVRDLAEHVAPLAALRSKEGSFFVTGNHEYYSGAAAWVGELRRLGLVVLMNEHAVVRRGEARLVIAGVTDFGAGHFDRSQASDPVAALAGSPAGAVRLLLAHQPRSAAAAEAAGFDLQLSGHTHGGQFLPWNFLVRLQQPFTAGLHRWRRMWVYTSRGTGYWGPPKRFGAPSEITLLRLVATPLAAERRARAPTRRGAAAPAA